MPTLRLVLPQALITTWRHDLVYQLRVARYQKIRYYTKEENESEYIDKYPLRETFAKEK